MDGGGSMNVRGGRRRRRIGPVELLLWTFRRSQADVVRMYGALSDVMRLAADTDMLNFGCWDGGARTPMSAQRRLCTVFGRAAGLCAGQRVVDVGSGYGAPASQWSSEYKPISIFSVNTAFAQLAACGDGGNGGAPAAGGRTRGCPGAARINAAAGMLPFDGCSVDRVLALESAQHFRPLAEFMSESYRILADGGKLAVAIPVIVKKGAGGRDAGMLCLDAARLGLLSLTWSSEHYAEGHVVSTAEDAGFEAESVRRIGHLVYEPLAAYYEENRGRIREKILQSYPPYVEDILHMSIRRMGAVSRRNVIDYVLAVLHKK